MNPSEFKLADMNPASYQYSHRIDPAFVMDPPPWIIHELKDDLLKEIYRIKNDYLSQIIELEAQKVNLVSKMYGKINKILLPLEKTADINKS